MIRSLAAAVRLLAVVAIALVAAGAERWEVDQPHRWFDPMTSTHGAHGLGGVAIGALAYAAGDLADQARRWRYVDAAAAGVLCGFGYELIAAADGQGEVDSVDATWVVAGSIVGAAITDLVGHAIAVTPRRDGAAVAIAWRF